MRSFDEALWDHLVEHHGADRAQVRATPAPPRRRPVVVGIAATGLAAAGVAAVLATNSPSASPTAGGPSAGGSGGSAHPTTAGSGGPDKGVNIGYIVERVKAHVASEARHNNTVQRSYSYSSGNVSSNGTLVNLVPEPGGADDYIAPDGTEYFHDAEYNTDGSPKLILTSAVGPVVNGKSVRSLIAIFPANHTYSQIIHQVIPSVPGLPADPTPSLGLDSSPAQVQQALQDGQVTRLGTPVFNGTPAIALSIKEPQRSSSEAPQPQSILYVDPQTYQPVAEVFPDDTLAGPQHGGLIVTVWVPATPANIARAKDYSIPAGYTKINEQTVGNSGAGTTTDSATTTNSGTG